MELLLEAPQLATSVSELVIAAQAGDRRAFGRLVERYQRSVYLVVLRRLGNEAEAQELCQDVFMRALRKLGQLRDPRCFGGWLRSIAKRLAVNWVLRRAQQRAQEAQAASEEQLECATPLAALLTRERAGQVRRGLAKLRAMDRETLVAFYFEGRSLAEMSTQFASPLGTIKRRLHVARKRLAEKLGALAPA